MKNKEKKERKTNKRTKRALDVFQNVTVEAD